MLLWMLPGIQVFSLSIIKTYSFMFRYQRGHYSHKVIKQRLSQYYNYSCIDKKLVTV
jgi:hypothetical protein